MDNKYTSTAILLHWLCALLIFVVFPLGLYMHDLPLSPDKLRLYSYHKWIGVLIFVLVIPRIAWRMLNTPPPHELNRLQKWLSALVHGLMYLLMLIIPVSGWLMSSAKGFQTVWFGILPLPDLVAKDKALGHLLEGMHQSLNYLLLAIVLLHVAAALKHQYIDKDKIMFRMLPGENK